MINLTILNGCWGLGVSQGRLLKSQNFQLFMCTDIGSGSGQVRLVDLNAYTDTLITDSDTVPGNEFKP
jgi:hypothetical protein